MKKMVEIFSCKRHGTSLIFGESRLIAAVDSPVPDFRIGSAEKPEKQKKETAAASEASAKKDAAAAVERAQGPLDKVALAAVKEKALAFVPVVSTDSNNPAANLDLRALVSSARDMADIGNILKEYPDIFPAAKFPELTREIETPATTTAPPAAAAETAPATIPETATAPIEAPETKTDKYAAALAKAIKEGPTETKIHGVNIDAKVTGIKVSALHIRNANTGEVVRTMTPKQVSSLNITLDGSVTYKANGKEFVRISYDSRGKKEYGFVAAEYLELAAAPAKSPENEPASLVAEKPGDKLEFTEFKSAPSAEPKLPQLFIPTVLGGTPTTPLETGTMAIKECAPGEEGAVKEGEVLILDANAGGVSKGTPVLVREVKGKQDGTVGWEITAETADGKTITLDRTGPGFAVGSTHEQVVQFADSRVGRRETLVLAAKTEIEEKLRSPRDVTVIKNIATANGGNIAAGTIGILQETSTGGYEFTPSETGKTKVSIAQLPEGAVTDHLLDVYDAFAQLPANTQIRRVAVVKGEADQFLDSGKTETVSGPVAICGSSGSEYLVRTQDGRDGLVAKNTIPDTAIARRNGGETVGLVLARVMDSSVAPAASAAVAAAPAGGGSSG